MVNKGINIGIMKKQNRENILRLLTENGMMSRKDIAKVLGLTPAALSIITGEMLAEGVLLEKGQQIEADKKAGRKKILLDINAEFRYVLGISIDSDYTSIGISNLKGETVAAINKSNNKIYQQLDPESVLRTIKEYCITLLWQNNLKKEEILGVGFGIIGPVDQREGVSKNAYGLFNERVPVKKILEDYLQIPVQVENNVRSLALAELAEQDDKINNMLFVKYGPGIGAAIVINGEIYCGSNNSAGEIGHNILCYDGEPCKCGRRGCLETLASEWAILKKVRKIFSRKETPVLYARVAGNKEAITMSKVIESAINGDLILQEIIEKAIYYTALAVNNAITLYDPDSVVFYGKEFRSGWFRERFVNYLRRMSPEIDFQQLISLSKVETKGAFAGGVALALREYFYREGGMVKKEGK